jgi:hypothetical protein
VCVCGVCGWCLWCVCSVCVVCMYVCVCACVPGRTEGVFLYRGEDDKGVAAVVCVCE